MNAQRMLRQSLEDLQRAGVNQVPRQLAEAAALLSQPAEPARPASPSPTATPQADSAAAGRSAPDRHRQQSVSTAPFPQELSATMSQQSPLCSNLSREQRVAQLSSLAGQVAACTRCQELADTRGQTVFGVGNPEAEVMFIGEAPGADEDAQGEPFVGRAGQLLNKIIIASQLTREEIYICNILRCRPPGNRNPSPVEASNCREYLDGQIETIAPQYIVCWGSCAAQSLLDVKTPIGKLRGRFFDYRGAKVVCTYHPSYLLRNPPAKKQVWEDMQFFRKDMGVNLK